MELRGHFSPALDVWGPWWRRKTQTKKISSSMQLKLTCLLLLCASARCGEDEWFNLKTGGEAPLRKKELQFWGKGKSHLCNCRKLSEACDQTHGGCKTCHKLWGGPLCQDLRAQSIPGQDGLRNHTWVPAELTDGDLQTCGAVGSGRVVLTMGKPYHFISLYLAGEEALPANVTVKLKDGKITKETYPSSRLLFKKTFLDGRAIQIKSHNSALGSRRLQYNQVVIEHLPNRMCSIDLSLGRNIALRAPKRNIFSTPSKVEEEAPSLVLDGSAFGVNRSLCYISQESQLNQGNLFWALQLSSPAVINHIVWWALDIEDYPESLGEPCHDNIVTCSVYGHFYCTQTVWAFTKCQKYCGLCGGAEDLRRQHVGYQVLYRNVDHRTFQVYTDQKEVYESFPVENHLALVSRSMVHSLEYRIRVKTNTTARHLGLCEMYVIGEFKCEPGKSGPYCEPCSDYTYGESCEESCDHCQRGWCTADHGVCVLDCMSGWYGEKCTKRCGKCGPIPDCDRATGVCESGCAARWHGQLCDTPCLAVCNNSCDRSNGRCHECVEGRYGYFCDRTCKDCVKACSRDNGFCDFGCRAGYFGVECTFSCTVTCLDNLCDQDTGACTEGCKHGFYGELCSIECSASCPERKCDRITGACTLDCPFTMQGDTCREESVPLLATVLFLNFLAIALFFRLTCCKQHHDHLRRLSFVEEEEWSEEEEEEEDEDASDESEEEDEQGYSSAVDPSVQSAITASSSKSGRTKSLPEGVASGDTVNSPVSSSGGTLRSRPQAAPVKDKAKGAAKVKEAPPTPVKKKP